MKNLIVIFITLISIGINAQSNAEMKSHFEKYYEMMKKHGDIQGVINAMTHLDVIEPSQARRDTIAYLYVSEGRHLQALNTIGVEKNATDSDMNVEVKALALKSLNQPKMALEHYDVLFSRSPNAPLAYEIADLMTQVDDLAGAKAKIEYGLTNSTDDLKRTFYERQQPYQASLKASFLYLKAIVLFKENKKANVDTSIKLVNDALAIDPNFNLAKVTREALEGQKAQLSQQN